MRPYRALSLVLATLVALSVTFGGDIVALGQSSGDAEETGARLEAAQGLVDSAIAERAAIELDLINTISRINELSDELSALSVGLDRITEKLSFADAELEGIAVDIELRAIDAYMSALGGTTISVVNSDSVEEALVTGLVVEDLINSDREAIDTLVIKKRGLEKLQQDFIDQQEAVAEKRAEFDSQNERLAELMGEADATVAEAIRAASIADEEHRENMDAIAEARAKEAESAKQDAKQPPTTSTTTTTTGGGAATTTTPQATTTTTTGGGAGYPWTPPPAVEQWRGLVSQHFPSNRVDEALHIMWCESGGDPNAYNPFSGASGLFQFIPSTWATTAPAAGYAGASPFEPVANVASAAWLANRYQELGQYYWTAWNCKRVLY